MGRISTAELLVGTGRVVTVLYVLRRALNTMLHCTVGGYRDRKRIGRTPQNVVCTINRNFCSTQIWTWRRQARAALRKTRTTAIRRTTSTVPSLHVSPPKPRGTPHAGRHLPSSCSTAIPQSPHSCQQTSPWRRWCRSAASLQLSCGVATQHVPHHPPQRPLSPHRLCGHFLKTVSAVGRRQIRGSC